MRKKCLGAPTDFHAARAKRLLDQAWLDLERMPPTCSGGIRLAARAHGYAQRAQAHLAAIDDRREREAHTHLYGSANRASNAAQKAINFFAMVCEAPHSETRDRPLTSRRRR
jgi:hypothetical protein